MAFPLHHWNKPRETIGARDDIGYTTEGAQHAIKILQSLDLRFSDTQNLTALDYGCGTGRITRVMSECVYNIIGFDPNKFCIDQAHIDTKRHRNYHNVIFTNDIKDCKPADLVYSIHVLEHLNDNDAEIAIRTMMNYLKPNGYLILNWNVNNNSQIIKKMMCQESVDNAQLFFAKYSSAIVQQKWTKVNDTLVLVPNFICQADGRYKDRP